MQHPDLDQQNVDNSSMKFCSKIIYLSWLKYNSIILFCDVQNKVISLCNMSDFFSFCDKLFVLYFLHTVE